MVARHGTSQDRTRRFGLNYLLLLLGDGVVVGGGSRSTAEGWEGVIAEGCGEGRGGGNVTCVLRG